MGDSPVVFLIRLNLVSLYFDCNQNLFRYFSILFDAPEPTANEGTRTSNPDQRKNGHENQITKQNGVRRIVFDFQMERWSGVLRVPLHFNSRTFHRVGASLCLSPETRTLSEKGSKMMDKASNAAQSAKEYCQEAGQQMKAKAKAIL